MKFDTKIKIVLWEGLKPWQALNVTAFLMSGIAGTQEIIGKPTSMLRVISTCPCPSSPS